MINKSQKVSSLENIYKNLESGMPDNNLQNKITLENESKEQIYILENIFLTKN